ncbi:histone-lysine N-methyltransferase ASHR1-like isoform X2 [Humulus lupulus]|uniref:histone-lysine N-methyltransferase ASHR1-like isoform X2 n=1 Tax=Humulus lupulus TaxID=3486 RepID=UPI002B409F81|nr:histone-lysine N-methyltransferase ASHR1-like isoform X2 [Humulus lupulus]
MEELECGLNEGCLSVSTLPDKGRCLFATRHFCPGEVILRERPYVSVPNNNSRCDGCFKTSSLKKCSVCQMVWYCSSSCQKEEWKLHRLECDALSKLDKERRKCVTPSLRLMLRLYIRKKLESERIIPATAMENYKLVEALISHMSDIDEKQLVYAQMANLVNLMLQLPDINIKEIAENFSKLACNAHTICDNELRPQGTGLFPIISIINHSCLPNSVLAFEGRLAVVRAVQHIPKDSEVLISYIETAGSTLTRQKALKEQYLFTCKCVRCIKLGQSDDVQEGAILEGYGCKNTECDGFLLRDSGDKGFICQQCGLVRSKEEIKELASEIKSLSEKVLDSVSSQNYQEVITTVTIEKLQRNLCHRFSISLMQTRDKLLKMFMELQNWHEALSYCRMTIPVYERVYPSFHPLLGLQYYTCGKLEWFLGETENGVKSLTKAVDVLKISHGTNTRFMKELLMKLDEARAEASYKQTLT